MSPTTVLLPVNVSKTGQTNKKSKNKRIEKAAEIPRGKRVSLCGLLSASGFFFFFFVCFFVFFFFFFFCFFFFFVGVGVGLLFLFFFLFCFFVFFVVLVVLYFFILFFCLSCFVLFAVFLFLWILSCIIITSITKTHLFKYIENVTFKKLKKKIR